MARMRSRGHDAERARPRCTPPRGPETQAAWAGGCNGVFAVGTSLLARRIASQRASGLASPFSAIWPMGLRSFACVTGGRPVNPLDDGGPPRAISLPLAGHVFGLLLVTGRVFSRRHSLRVPVSRSSSGHQPAPSGRVAPLLWLGPTLTASLGSPGCAVLSGPARAY